MVVFFLFTRGTLPAQPLFMEAGYAGLGNVISPVVPGIPNLVNPASLGLCENHSLTVSQYQPFLVPQIGVNQLHLVLMTPQGAFQGGIGQMGIPGFSIISMRMAYGMKLNDRITAGVTFRYLAVAAAEKLNYLWNLAPGAGLLFRYDEQITISVMILSPVSAGNENDYTGNSGWLGAVGLSKQVYERTFLLLELASDRSTILRVKAALAYEINRQWHMHLGYQSSPHTYTTGIACLLNKMKLVVASGWTPARGMTPALSLSVPIRRKTKEPL